MHEGGHPVSGDRPLTFSGSYSAGCRRTLTLLMQ